MRFSEYRAMDATAMVAGVRNGDFTALELASAATDRMRAVNDRINAVVLDLTEPGIQQIRDGLPQGPLAGLPFLVKDMDGTLAGHPCSMGSKSLRDWVPDHDSNLFARYRAAGVVFLGKTNCPEFGLLGHTEPDLWGPARNPWNLNHTPGGSSGGAGAAVAAGIVPVAHGGDGGGSIRIPASFNGLFGLKPSRGRMPLGPDVGEGWNGFVVPHVITRSVRDSALFLATSHGPDEGAPYGEPPGSTRFVAATQRRPSRLRIAVSRAAFLTDPIHPDCLDAVDDAVALLTDLGHTVEEITLELDQHALTTAYFTVCAAGAAVDIATTEQRTGRKPTRDRFERTTWLMGKIGRVFSAADLETARVTIDRARRSVAHQLAGFDAHLSPTTAFPASEIGAQDQSRLEQIGMDTIRRVSSVTGPLIDPVYLTLLDQIGSKLLERISNPMLFNMTGQPAMSVPLWWNDRGLPVGVQFAAGYGHEALLLGLAAQLEEARPWFDRIPPL